MQSLVPPAWPLCSKRPADLISMAIFDGGPRFSLSRLSGGCSKVRHLQALVKHERPVIAEMATN